MQTEYEFRVLRSPLQTMASRLWVARHSRCFKGILLTLSMLFFLSLFGCGTKEAAPAATPPDVETTGVVEQDVPIYGEWIAILDGYVNAQIQPQITGYLMKRNYREGSFVRRGEVLF